MFTTAIATMYRGTILLLAAVAFGAQAQDATRVVCYYSSWAIYRTGPGKFGVGDIDPTLCTHIMYSFIGLESSGNLAFLDPWNDIGDASHPGQIQSLQALKVVNPNIKLMLAVGGYNAGPANFQEVVRKPVKRAIMVQSAVDMLTTYKMDGLDIDWEYQDGVGGTEADKTGLTALLNELRAKFDESGLLVSVTTPPNFSLVESSYELDKVSAAVDFINIMAYDFHGAWEAVTGHVTPLHSANGANDPLSVEALINFYIKQGAVPAKVNVGLITYGRSFTLTNSAQHGLGAPAKGPGAMGTIIPEAGVLAYGDICLNKWTEVWDETQAVPYAYNGDQWVGYDNADSLIVKIEFGRTLKLGGVMIWSLESDDFNGNCGTPYPLLQAINNYIKRV